MNESNFDVVVIGLGAVGSATLYQLSKRGINSLGIDQFEPPHTLGSSHGETRITRLAVGEGEEYVALAKRSHEIWAELEALSGKKIRTKRINQNYFRCQQKKQILIRYSRMKDSNGGRKSRH